MSGDDSPEVERYVEGAGPSWDPRRAGVRRPPPERLGTFGIGSVIGRAFSIYGRNLLPFAVISLVLHLPLFAYLTYGSGVGRPESDGGILVSPNTRIFVARDAFASWMWIPIALIVSGPIAYGVVQQLRGRRPSIAACVAEGARSIPRVLGVGLTMVAAVAGIVFTFILLFFTGLGLTGPLLGFFLVVALMFVVMALLCRHAVAVTAAVVERVGPSTALARSRRLTRGNAWRIFGLWFVVSLLEGLLSSVTGLLTGGPHGTRPRFALLVDAVASGVLWTPLLAVALAVLYHDLRVTAEGVGADELARVFE